MENLQNVVSVYILLKGAGKVPPVRRNFDKKLSATAALANVLRVIIFQQNHGEVGASTRSEVDEVECNRMLEKRSRCAFRCQGLTAAAVYRHRHQTLIAGRAADRQRNA